MGSKHKKNKAKKTQSKQTVQPLYDPCYMDPVASLGTVFTVFAAIFSEASRTTIGSTQGGDGRVRSAAPGTGGVPQARSAGGQRCEWHRRGLGRARARPGRRAG